MKKMLSLVITLVILTFVGNCTAEPEAPGMQLRVAIPKITLWSEPNNKSMAVKDQNNKSIKLSCGTVVYETPDMYGRTNYGDFVSVCDTAGNRGYLCKKYLVYGYKILLVGSTQDIYRTEWGARNDDQGIGAVVASRKNEELLVIGETVDCLQVLTVENPEGITGYISRYAYYTYVYDEYDE